MVSWNVSCKCACLYVCMCVCKYFTNSIVPKSILLYTVYMGDCVCLELFLYTFSLACDKLRLAFCSFDLFVPFRWASVCMSIYICIYTYVCVYIWYTFAFTCEYILIFALCKSVFLCFFSFHFAYSYLYHSAYFCVFTAVVSLIF